MASKLKITPLGGVSEIGKNMTVIEYGKDIIIIDCGSIFPSDEMPGIDLVIPDMSYLDRNADRIRGVVITHGHEDHIGATPYFLRKFPKVPLYGSKLTIALIAHKLEEHGNKDARLHVVQAGDVLRLGCMQVEFIHTNHSIAGSFALGIKTPIGNLIHTGDFKVDYTPVDGGPIDLARFAAYGEEGVLALMSDSTNAESPGYTVSERKVGETVEDYFEEAKGRIIVATFASNIHRIQQVCDAAVRNRRKICFQGRSMINVSNLAKELGYLQVDPKHVVELEELKSLKDNRICVITTGSQGEPLSGLARMASDSHKLTIKTGDMVIISASAIPGNEKSVSHVINQLFQRGVTVIYQSMADIHTSGHAKQEELKLILTLTKPKYFIPVHGEYRHLVHHVMLAEGQGVPNKNIFMVQIGDTVELTRGGAKKLEANVPSGSVMIDGSGIGDIGSIVLRDRKLLSEDGLFVVVTTLDKKTGELIAGPEIISRGFVYMRESEELIEGARKVVRKVVQSNAKKSKREWSQLKVQIKNELRDYLYLHTKRNPVILPIVVEV